MKNGSKNCKTLSRGASKAAEEVSQTLQSLQDRKKQCEKDADKCSEEVEQVKNEIAERTESQEVILGRRGAG